MTRIMYCNGEATALIGELRHDNEFNGNNQSGRYSRLARG